MTRTIRTYIHWVLLLPILLAGGRASGQIYILGKDPRDAIMPGLWANPTNANNTILGLGTYGTKPFPGSFLMTNFWNHGVNIRDAGAVADGSTDNGTLLQTLINANAEIIIPPTLPGLPFVTRSLTLPSNTRLRLHPSAELKLKNGGNNYLFRNANTNTGNYNIFIEGGTLNFNGANQTATADWKSHGVYFRNVTNITLRDLTVTNAYKFAIRAGDWKRFYARGIHFETPSDGIHLHGPGDTAEIFDLTGTTGDDMVALAGDDWTDYRGESVGPIQNVTVRGVHPKGSLKVLRVIGSSYSPMRNITLEDTDGTTTSSIATVAEDQTTGMVVEDLTLRGIKTVPGTNQSGIFIVVSSGRNILVDDYTYKGNATALNLGGSNDLLTVRSMVVKGSNARAIASAGTVDMLKINGGSMVGLGGAPSYLYQAATSDTNFPSQLRRVVVEGVGTTNIEKFFNQEAGVNTETIMQLSGVTMEGGYIGFDWRGPTTFQINGLKANDWSGVLFRPENTSATSKIQMRNFVNAGNIAALLSPKVQFTSHTLSVDSDSPDFKVPVASLSQGTAQKHVDDTGVTRMTGSLGLSANITAGGTATVTGNIVSQNGVVSATGADIAGAGQFGTGAERVTITELGVGFGRHPGNGTVGTTNYGNYQIYHIQGAGVTNDVLVFQSRASDGTTRTNALVLRSDGYFGVGVNPLYAFDARVFAALGSGLPVFIDDGRVGWNRHPGDGQLYNAAYGGWQITPVFSGDAASATWTLRAFPTNGIGWDALTFSQSGVMSLGKAGGTTTLLGTPVIGGVTWPSGPGSVGQIPKITSPGVATWEADGGSGSGGGVASLASAGVGPVVDGTTTNLYPVFNPAKTYLIFDGDSNTKGSSIVSGHGWPYYLTNGNIPGWTGFAIATNAAIGGKTLADKTNEYATYIYPLKPGAGTNSVRTLLIGANDALGGSADTYITTLSNHLATAQADGFKMGLMTLPPQSGNSELKEKNRSLLNKWVREISAADYVFDADALFPNATNSQWFESDGTHLNDNAHLALAKHVDYVLRQGPRNSSTLVGRRTWERANGVFNLRDDAGDLLERVDVLTGAHTVKGLLSAPQMVLTNGLVQKWRFLSGTNWAIDASLGGVSYKAPSVSAASWFYLTNTGGLTTNDDFTIKVEIDGGQGLQLTNTVDANVNFAGQWNLMQGTTNYLYLNWNGIGWTALLDPPGYTGTGVGVNSTGASMTNLTLKSTTFQAGQNANVLKFRNTLAFSHPFRSDQVGGIMNTNDPSAPGYGQVVMSGGAATNGNWVQWSYPIPKDFDSSVDAALDILQFVSGGTSTSAVGFTLGMACIPDGGDANPTTFSNFVKFGSGTLPAHSSGAIHSITNITLTNWASAMVPLRRLVIILAREGDTDANNDTMRTAGLDISVGAAQ